MAMKDIKILSSEAHGPADPGGKRLKIAKVTFDFDSVYPTGGEALDLSSYFKEIVAVIPIPKLGYSFYYDLAAKTLMAYYYDYDASADGAAIQVANGANLSAVTDVELIVLGY